MIISPGLITATAFAMGWPPAMALESARRAIPAADRPGFDELEQMLRESKKGGGA